MIGAEKVHQIVKERADDIVAFTQSVVATPSVTGQEGPCAQKIADEMRRIGLEVQEVEVEKGRPNVLGLLRSGNSDRKFLLNGHIDVVHPGPRRDWELDPFSGLIKDGFIHGRGAVDMKGGLCGMIKAVEIIKELGINLNRDILLTAVVDEQVGATKGTDYLLKNGYFDGSDLGLNTEPTHMRIEICHKGAFKCFVTNYGKAIHGARPWLGINAIEKSVDLINRLRTYKQEVLDKREHPLLGNPTINIGLIRGGEALNLVPSESRVAVDRRIIPGETVEQVRDEFHAILDQLSAADPDFKYDLEMQSARLGLDVSEDAPVVRAMADSFGDLFGRDVVIGGKAAGTEAAMIGHYLGIDMPIFGPGEYVKYSLGPNEKLAVDDLLDATKLYLMSMIRVLGSDTDV